MSIKPTPEDTAHRQRRLASQANNRVWSLSDQRSRTAGEDEEMLAAAHTANYLWGFVGNRNNKAHTALLPAHVYATPGVAFHRSGH